MRCGRRIPFAHFFPSSKVSYDNITRSRPVRKARTRVFILFQLKRRQYESDEEEAENL